MNRERWLRQAVEELRPYFKAANAQIPEKVRVSCGFPSKNPVGKKKRAIGQCWPKALSEDGYNEVFISPLLKNPVQVLDVLVHELVHAWDDCVNGHKGPFLKTARALGQVGKATQTSAGDELKVTLQCLAAKLGPYPHGSLSPATLESTDKQTTRLLKVVCPDQSCGVVVRMTRKYIEAGLIPTCACGTEMRVAS